MKKIVRLKVGVTLLALAGLSSAALATTPGAYLGAGLGYGYLESDINTNNHDTNFSSSVNKSSVAGRAFAGYNFNEYIGIEGGYSYLGRAQYTVTQKATGSNVNFTDHLQDGDLVLKAYLPVSDTGLNFYALGGAAYVHSNVSANLTYGGKTFQLNGAAGSSNALRPKYGIGASYDIPNTQLTTSLEFSRVQGLGSQSAIPSADSALLTISYHFD